MASRGVCYVAYGATARAEAAVSIQTLRDHNKLDVTVIGDKPQHGAGFIELEQVDAGGRWAKLSLDSLSPYDETLYLDADTRVKGDLSEGFRILDKGFDLAITASTKQGPNVMIHAPLEDRQATFEAYGIRQILALQAGVFYFARNSRTAALFEAWRDEWVRWRYLDQPALLRALLRAPVRLYLLGRPYNGGDLVQHLFGRARG